jgi:hypothetical protein
MRKVYIVTLTGQERERLGALVSKGAARARAIKRAHILLLADEGKRPGGQRRLSGDAEAYLVALACSTPPGGRRQWTMQLLADRLVEMGTVAAISDETVRRTLKKGASNPGSTNNGASLR